MVLRTHMAMAVLLGLAVGAARGNDAKPLVFPRDAAVLDARRDLGAKGDGVADDTDALQKGLDASCGIGGKPTKILFLPEGTYRLTRTLVVKSAIGPWLYGASRDGTVLRLDNGVKDCNAVLRTHPRESGKTSSDWFMRNIRNLTIDAGENPGTDGIRFYATNSGILKNLRITGHGKIGINSSFLGQSGPNMVQDTLVEGFDTGAVCSWVYGQTLSRVTFRRCRTAGLVVAANAVAVEDLTVEDTPVALRNEVPNNWRHWGGVVALVGGRFSAQDGAGAAIHNEAVLYARDLKIRGYKAAIESATPGGNVAAGDVDEYLSHPVTGLYVDAPARGLKLPIKPEPEVAWETDPSKWLCANDFGAVAGDNKDDTAALQKALDVAAAAGKTVVYLRGIGGGDPNWYTLEGEVRVHGSVRMVMGLGFGRIVAGPNGRFVVADEPGAAPVVKFQHIDSFGGRPATLENRGARTLVAESCGVTLEGTGPGAIFATDCPAHLYLRHKGACAWARHFNAEGTAEEGLVHNAGGTLWMLGTKAEGAGLRYKTSAGGKTEIFGAFGYSNVPIEKGDTRAMFEIDDATMCLMGVKEICHTGKPYQVKVREKRGVEVRTLLSEKEGGWMAWSLYSGQAGR